MGCEYLPWYPPVRRNIPYADPVTLRCLPEPARFAHSEWQAFQPSRRACTHYTGADCSAKQSAADYGLGCCLGPGLGRTPRFSLQPHAQLWHYPPRAAPSRSLGAPSSPRAVDAHADAHAACERCPTTSACAARGGWQDPLRQCRRTDHTGRSPAQCVCPRFGHHLGASAHPAQHHRRGDACRTAECCGGRGHDHHRRCSLHYARGHSDHPQKRGHYFLRVKDNQPHLLRALSSFFASTTRRAQAATLRHTRTLKGHGRLETYQLRSTTALNGYLESEYGWPELAQVVCIEHTRIMLDTGLVIRTVPYADRYAAGSSGTLTRGGHGAVPARQHAWHYGGPFPSQCRSADCHLPGWYTIRMYRP